MMVADPDRTKATPSQLNFPTSPNLSTMGDCTSATIVLSSEKRNVEDKMVKTMSHHYIEISIWKKRMSSMILGGPTSGLETVDCTSSFTKSTSSTASWVLSLFSVSIWRWYDLQDVVKIMTGEKWKEDASTSDQLWSCRSRREDGPGTLVDLRIFVQRSQYRVPQDLIKLPRVMMLTPESPKRVSSFTIYGS